MNELHYADETVDPPRKSRHPVAQSAGDGYREQPESGHHEVALDLQTRRVPLPRIEFQSFSLPPRVPMEQREDPGDGRKAQSVDHKEQRHILHSDRGGGARMSIETEHAVYKQGEDELQWIDVEQDEEQQHAVESDGKAVLQAVATEEQVVPPPGLEQHEEADAESDEAAHRDQQFLEILWHLQRDHEQGERKAEDRVAEALETRHGPSAPPEIGFPLHILVYELLPYHRSPHPNMSDRCLATNTTGSVGSSVALRHIQLLNGV